MPPRHMRAVGAALAVSLLLVFALAGTTSAQATLLVAALSGDQEVAPGTPGSATDTGAAVISINPETMLVCFALTTNLMEPVTASHIHAGAAGVAGGIVVGLTGVPNSSVSGSWSTSTTGTHLVGAAAPLADIVANPANYYVNFHTATAPGGHVRGQLAAAPAGTTDPCPRPSDTSVTPPAMTPLALFGFSLVAGAAGLGMPRFIRRMR